MEPSNIDLSTIENLNRILISTSEGGSLFDTEQLISAIQPYLTAALIILVVIAALYIIHIIQKMRVNHAIMETRDILREMNQREKGETILPQPANHKHPDKA